MNKYFRYLRKNLRKIYRALLFIACAVLVISVIPRQGVFKYEFPKGKPWMYETYIAPFDFAVYKDDKVYKNELDSVLRHHKLYFEYNSQAEVEAKKGLKEGFEDSWKDFIASRDDFKKIVLPKLEKIKTDYLLELESLFSEVYKKGIVDQSYKQENIGIFDNKNLMLIRNNIASEELYSNIFTFKSAYQYLKDTLSNKYNDKLASLFFDIEIDKYIYPNVKYDKEKSEKFMQSIIQEVSLTKGMVQANERIISQGDIVTEEKYQILSSIKREFEENISSVLSRRFILLGQSVLIFLIFFILFLFFKNYRKELYVNNLHLSFILFLIILFVFIASVVVKYEFFSIYIIPFALIPIIVQTFLDSRTSLFVSIITIFIVGFIAPNKFEFIFLQLIAAITANYSLSSLQRRGQLVMSSGIIILTYSILHIGLSLIQEGDFSKIEWKVLIWFFVNGLLLLFSYPLIYIFEKIFGFISDVTLMEISDVNHPLLRKMARTAPGTFYHSLQVATLAEEAVRFIGGNPLLVRAGALYHDIGKMNHPVFFIENQSTDKNPHDKLDFDRSAKIITDHVKDGVKLAKKYNLPEPIIHFITTHHGSGRVEYFYRSFKNKYPDKEIDEEVFTYPGPNPFSKETAVLMMADKIEASVRSLKEKTIATIKKQIDDMIDSMIHEKRFEEADITFKEINVVRDVFADLLSSFYHARIEYPDSDE